MTDLLTREATVASWAEGYARRMAMAFTALFLAVRTFREVRADP